jgi:hypothetical protein
MTDQTPGEYRPVVHAYPYQDEEYQEPGLLDGIRFLYQRRVRLVARFILFMGIGVIAFLYVRFSTPTIVQGTVALTFRGIERGEYPTGKKFSVEDFRSPDLLAKALSDAAIPADTIGVRTLAAQLFITPIIPGDVQAIWRKQERDGLKKDEYYPNEFSIGIGVSGLSNTQRIRLFDALAENYRERVKYEQEAALSFVGNSDTSYEKLATRYDFWDIPSLFEDTYRSLDEELSTLITESLQYQDPKYQLAFRNVSKELNTWFTMRLQVLEALTYQGRLVKNRDTTILRIQYRIKDIGIQVTQKRQEASEAERLLGLIEQPRVLLTGQLSSKEGVPVIDVGTLEKLLKSDYIGPVVTRVSKLQEETQALEAEKTRLQEQLTWLPKATNVDIKRLPPGYGELIQTLTSELNTIIQNYNRLLDEYLTATITSLVSIKQSPIVAREQEYSSALMLAGIVTLSFFLAIFMITVEHLFQKAKQPATTPKKENVKN